MASIISAGTTDSTSLNISGDKTGILQLASNNAVTAVTIDASQNVGIGTGTPGVKLDLNGGDFRIQQSAATARQRFIAGSNQWNVETSNSTNQYAIYDAAAGLARMVIDSSGRMTLPYQPAFSAYRGSLTLPTQTWTTIVYDNCTINRGSCYSTSTGRFTAPVAGYYYFEAIGEGAGGAFHTLMSVNGGTPAGQGDGAQNWTSSNVSRQAFVLSLAAGDYVYVQHYIDSARTMTSNRCHFHGFLLG